MGFFDGYNIATSGMSAQRTRINIVSANIANAQTTKSIDGGPYKKQNVVFQEVLLNTQKNEKNSNNLQIIEDNKKNFNNVKNPIGVGVKEIIEARTEPILKYEPEHPEADEKGYVAYPNINPVIEMTDLIEAMRTYEANLSAFQTQKAMDTKTLDILKG